MLKAFFVMLISYQTLRSQALSFFPRITSNGSALCAVGNPSYTIQTDDIIGVPYVVPGATKCGFFCTGLNSKINCTGFNYLTSGLCQFFSGQRNYCDSTIKGCKYYYQVTLTSQNPSSNCQQISPYESNSCSFPYTYQGQLYYECTVFNTTTGSLGTGCYSTGGVKPYDSNKCNQYVNIALNRPATQVNTYNAMSASYSVDGGVGTVSCTHSAFAPWWSVDLGQHYNVRMIKVTDDSNPTYFNRMTNFFAWLSNTQPTVGQTLDTSRCSLCRQYSGTFSADRLTVNVTCQWSLIMFRYVIIQSSWQSYDAICLAEVEVYAGFTIQTVNVPIPTTTSNVPLMSVNGWITITSRINSNFSTALNWTMYKSGFGDITSNFWHGLERIFQLTNVNNNGGVMYRLRFELQSTSGRWYSEEYDWFYIESEAQFYKLHVSLFAVGDAGDSLNSPLDPRKTSNGMSFSSPDVDNDLSSGNCAQVQGGGWWYSDCSASTQLGLSGVGFLWETLNPGEMNLMASRMMIKSIN